MAGRRMGRTWLSTSMAMSTNMSCSSLMLLSRRTMSLCLDSISLRACLEMPESTICVGRTGEVNTDAPQEHLRLKQSRPKVHTHTPHILHTPAVKTAALPLSNISSSSSSVVAFPAERKSELNTEKIAACSHDETNMYVGVTHWSPAVSECDLYSSPWSPPGLRYIWSLPPQTSWTGQHARTRPEKKKDFTSEKVETILKQDHLGWGWRWEHNLPVTYVSAYQRTPSPAPLTPDSSR